MSFKLTSQEKEKLEALDVILTSNTGFHRLDEGVKYARWAIPDGSYPDEVAERVARDFGADGHFNGLVMGKPQMVLFFMPSFE